MEKGIKASWKLIAFAKSHGKMKVAPFVNKETGEAFKSCMFVNSDGEVTAKVNFSSQLGELTPQQIASQKDELWVVELKSGTYKLCKAGSTWEDVDLGL
jgi:hypothetical protein